MTTLEAGRPIVIGLLNNMPDRAMRQTEAQFRDLLTAAAPGRAIRLELFTLPGVPREGLPGIRVAANYRPFAELWDAGLDGLIVTGAEPRAAALAEEPFWRGLTGVVDQARDRCLPTIWSCLAAHAAVLHLDGVQRRRRPAKLSGLFACAPAAPAHPWTSGLPALWASPHSRYHEVVEQDLLRRGYRILSRGDELGVDAFVADDLPFLFLQGHPEYDSRALLREYLRDAVRYLSGDAASCPDVPHGYLDDASAAMLAGLVADGPGAAALAGLRQAVRETQVPFCSTQAATTLFGNWLASLAACAPLPHRLTGGDLAL